MLGVQGFPCVVGHEVPTENDGLAGAVAIARAALTLGKAPVVLLTDECNAGPVAACVAWLQQVWVWGSLCTGLHV